jgi:hypothetical protein
MPIANGAAKDAARRSMRGCTGITATGRSSARSSMRRKLRAASQKTGVPVDDILGCESASKVDPCFLGQVNELARRSAWGPYAE